MQGGHRGHRVAVTLQPFQGGADRLETEALPSEGGQPLDRLDDPEVGGEPGR